MKAKSKYTYTFSVHNGKQEFIYVTDGKQMLPRSASLAFHGPMILEALQQARLSLQDVSEAACNGKTQEACELADEAAECCQIAIARATGKDL